MATTKNIIVFGGTGLIGSHILQAILNSASSFGKIAIFTSQNTVWTKSEEIDELKQRGVEIISGNITSVDAVKEAYNGFDTVVSCVGRPVIHHQLQLIQLADEHPDVKRFFPSEYGTDIEYGPASANEPPHQQKLRVRSFLKGVHNLEYSLVVTGPYGNAESGLYLSAREPGKDAAGSFDVKNKRAVLIGDGNGPISLTTMRDVGKLVVAAILHPEASKNKVLKVNSFTSTPNEIVAEFEKQTGDKWDVSYTSLDKLKQLEKEAYDDKNPQAGGFTLRRIWAEGSTLYNHRDNGAIDMEGKMDSLKTTVEQAIAVQRA